MSRTVWLASYPKSGNTWFRVFLANLLFPAQAPVDLNRLPLQTPISTSRSHFDDLLGIPSALLSADEVERLRPAADQELRRVWPEPLLLRKAHDAYTSLADGRPLMGKGPDFAAIYILRNPWDVAVSLANHFNSTLDDAVNNLCSQDFLVPSEAPHLSYQLAVRLLSWEEHVRSWLTAQLPLYLIRYEEMHQDPLSTFRGAIRFLGLDCDDRAIQLALAASSFEKLQVQEQEERFRETPPGVPRFFRSGLVGEGLNALSVAQIERLEAMKARVEQTIDDRMLAP